MNDFDKMQIIPLVEYDNSEEIISPSHDRLKIKIPNNFVLAFLGTNVKKYVAHNFFKCKKVAIFNTSGGSFSIYKTKIRGKEIGFCMSPIGAPAATQLLDWLIAYGAKTIIAVGSCGALIDDIEGELFLPTKALRDEGTSYHYLPANRWIDLDKDIVNEIYNILEANKIKFRKCATWTTDAFFRETKEKTKKRIDEGCQTVEMECSSLAACAKLRGAKFGMILYTADSLVNKNGYTKRNWGKSVSKSMLKIALKVASHLEN